MGGRVKSDAREKNETVAAIVGKSRLQWNSKFVTVYQEN